MVGKVLGKALSELLVLTILIAFSPIHASTIMLDLPLKRALISAQPDPAEQRPHAFSWCPFGRVISVNDAWGNQKDVFGGLLLDYRYRFAQNWWLDFATALAHERINPKSTEHGLPALSRFGFDDITIQLGYDFLGESVNIFSPYLFAALPTIHANPDGVLVSTGNAVFGPGFDAFCVLWQHDENKFLGAIMSALFVHSFKRTVTLDKKFKMISSSNAKSSAARFNDSFDIGNAFFGLLGLRYDFPFIGLEFAYNPNVIFSVEEELEARTRHRQGLNYRISQKKRSSMMSQVTTPIRLFDGKPFVIHAFYAQVQTVVHIGCYDLAIIAGASYGASQRGILKRWTGWASMSLRF